MREATEPSVVVSGVGVSSPIGIGRDSFLAGLLAGEGAFGIMRRRGRQRTGGADGEAETAFIGAELPELGRPDRLDAGLARTLSLSAQAAVTTVEEAWDDARLSDIDPKRIGLIVGGSNVQQRELMLLRDRHRGREAFLRPTYGMQFMDTDLCGALTEVFGIEGFSQSVGGASASGQLAVIEAAQAVRAGRADAVMVVGALMDLSHWECQGFRSLGAMGTDRFAEAPDAACRPFDEDRDGFIFGENCAALVVERADGARGRDLRAYASLAGHAVAADGNRNPDPSHAGEVRAIRGALEAGGLAPSVIDYVNPHGTGSHIGDSTELDALRTSGLDGASINATKASTGHGLSAAGAVEIVATLLQMRAGKLHPTRNLERPIDPSFDWVRGEARPARIDHALCLSMGFGGINTALCLAAS